jgi:hypothetical protein
MPPGFTRTATTVASFEMGKIALFAQRSGKKNPCTKVISIVVVSQTDGPSARGDPSKDEMQADNLETGKHS